MVMFSGTTCPTTIDVRVANKLRQEIDPNIVLIDHDELNKLRKR